MTSRRPFRFGARARSLGHALAGLRVMLGTQHNAWVHVTATAGVIVAAVLCEVTRVEWLALITAITGVWVAEALNTALEQLADKVSPEIDPLVKRSKDVAAGAVLCAALGAAAVGVLVFGPRLADALAA